VHLDSPQNSQLTLLADNRTLNFLVRVEPKWQRWTITCNSPVEHVFSISLKRKSHLGHFVHSIQSSGDPRSTNISKVHMLMLYPAYPAAGSTSPVIAYLLAVIIAFTWPTAACVTVSTG